MHRLLHRRLTSLSVFALGASLLCAETALRAQAAVTVTQMAASLHVLALLSDGSVVGWGENRSGQLGLAEPATIAAPRRIPLPRKAIGIAANTEASYAVLDDGTVMAWGRDYEGQLGTRTFGDERGLKMPTPERVHGLTHVTQVVAEGNAAVALRDDGTVMEWGNRTTGIYVNDELKADAFEPTVVRGVTDAVDVTFNGDVGFARLKDGRVMGWGRNGDGQLGLGESTDGRHAPVEIPALKGARAVVSGGATIVIKADGTAWAWGSNVQGGFGNGKRAATSGESTTVPQQVPGVANVVALKRGTFGRHFIALLADHTLVGWGNSDWGQLGAGVIGNDQPSPRPIKLAGVEAYWLGGNYSFARTADGALWFWGEQKGARPILGQALKNQALPVRLPLEAILQAK
ncbi:MAG: hypothetical protein U0Q11_12525 [Vicinamibacterales bacterium]